MAEKCAHCEREFNPVRANGTIVNLCDFCCNPICGYCYDDMATCPARQVPPELAEVFDG